MEKLVIKGGNKLYGIVKTSGAKNAVLPILAASILGKTPSLLEDIPNLADVKTICQVLECLGVKIEKIGTNSLRVDSSNITSCEAPYELINKMRASFLVMGSLLARCGQARISQPGGCAIGTRPIDIHLKGFEALGVKIECGDGYIQATAPAGGMIGTTIYLDFPSVGATENIMMAAAMAKGQTILENPAQEPEIIDLANYLNVMGARVRGAGTNKIRIDGVAEMFGAEHTVIPDRIEAGTYMVAVAMTGGDVRVDNVYCEHLSPLISKLREMGVTIHEDVNGVRVIGSGVLKAADIKTLPHPGFPTDMQAQVMALLTVAQGNSVVTETVFENRFMHVAELQKMGANIVVDGRQASIAGGAKLSGGKVDATDLRAGAALVLAGLVATGETEVGCIYHIDRGYECIVDKFCSLGADIKRVDS